MGWLDEARKVRPDAEAIARTLNASGALLCEHEHDPCYSRCSVRRLQGVWVVISEVRRQEWFDRILENIARDEEERQKRRVKAESLTEAERLK